MVNKVNSYNYNNIFHIIIIFLIIVILLLLLQVLYKNNSKEKFENDKCIDFYNLINARERTADQKKLNFPKCNNSDDNSALICDNDKNPLKIPWCSNADGDQVLAGKYCLGMNPPIQCPPEHPTRIE